MPMIEVGLPEEDRELLREINRKLDWFKSQVAPADGLLTTKEAAELARVEPVTIRSWVSRGQLEVARRAGNKMLFRREDVLSLAEPQSRPG